MEELEVIKKDEYIDHFHSVTTNNNSMLIVSEKGLEVIRYHMPKNLIGNLPRLEPLVIETYYLLKGKLQLLIDGEMVILEAGDSFVLNNNPQDIPFTVVEDLTMMVSTNDFAYRNAKEKSRELNKIMAALQEQDGDTKTHCERVKNYALAMIHYLNCDLTRVDNLFYAARFHDVGKMDIPLEILIKPDKLNDAEFAIMKTHPQSSYEIVKKYFGEDIAQITLQHHERPDGKGYPQGLKGDKISQEAKIIAVADAYDAMITVRPYNKGKTKQAAVKELIDGIDQQFDRDCVNALIQHLKNTNQISD